MGDTGGYDVRSYHRDEESEIARLRSQALMGWAKEARVLEQFGLRDGMAVVDLGSGPGFVTDMLLERVPGGSVTAVELDADLAARADGYLRGQGHSHYRVVRASIYDTGLPDASYDFALARAVFQHLKDPLAAAREAFRLLRPGGRLVITESDAGLTAVLDPPVPELLPLVDKLQQVRVSMGSDPYIGRRLCRLLTDAGFAQVDLEAAILHSDLIGLEPFQVMMDPDRMLPLVKRGLFSAEEWETVRSAIQRFFASPGPMMFMVVLMACGTRP